MQACIVHAQTQPICTPTGLHVDRISLRTLCGRLLLRTAHSGSVPNEIACDRGGFTGPYILGILSTRGFALPMYVLGGCNLVAACILLILRPPSRQGLPVASEAATSSPRAPDAQGSGTPKSHHALCP